MVNTASLTKPSLRLNDSGPAVKELQTLLDGYSKFIDAPAIAPGAIDSNFGPGTQNAVMAFQEQVFLPRTGIVADLTWRSLYKRDPVDLPEVKFGATSDSVKLLEERLIRLGFFRGQTDRKYEQRWNATLLATFPMRYTLREKESEGKRGARADLDNTYGADIQRLLAARNGKADADHVAVPGCPFSLDRAGLGGYRLVRHRCNLHDRAIGQSMTKHGIVQP